MLIHRDDLFNCNRKLAISYEDLMDKLIELITFVVFLLMVLDVITEALITHTNYWFERNCEQLCLIKSLHSCRVLSNIETIIAVREWLC